MIDLTTPCDEWLGRVDRYGYGRIGRSGKAHLIAYERAYGPIPNGLEVDHVCRNRRCWNAKHLEAVDHRTNLLRGHTIPAINAAKTHCANGHQYDEANTYIYSDGSRRCRKCDSDRHKARRRVSTALRISKDGP